ncbi:hypothetical protein ACIGW4_20105 [Streptomyces sp. NPDC053513]|uniref:hypothetical protein n=1 Tax=unclassified Streptomyces TaxID=2593676 RepID=UPI0037CED465
MTRATAAGPDRRTAASSASAGTAAPDILVGTPLRGYRRRRPSARTAGPMPYRWSRDRAVVGETPRRRATAPVLIP